ncbi:C2H2-type domain-containing protein [Caenorhabditis elegans]|uniref:C2H2-type domain-containing protein n=1 Tax=Caenorhabditis elegans TaxID=6239 RepID=Q5WRU9_CAEEL|nr:C2H2-type domain-containing protein [Caenorhabditis elegans]CCD66010.1 C2H2-type domain-containing protein [Caenorhabditis elegans]|eukprot:NP_001122679.1 Uncharacterized protein CELE_C29E4.13 [Caenorhabditis elegans]
MNEDRLDFRYLKSGNEGIMINKTIDPSQASMSNWKPVDDEKTHNLHSQNHRNNRLRTSRETTVAVAESAKKNGMQTIHRSGSNFVVPITMQAHPTHLSDRYLDEKDDILSQHKALPYCCHCNAIIKTWRGFEYHVLCTHLKYRPYRCFHCKKDGFYTEEEGRFHLSTRHPKDEVTLFKEYDPKKETAAREAFKQIFLICRDGPEVTKDRVHEWEREAEVEVMKFANLKFKRPIVLVRKLTSHSRQVQTPTYQNISLDSCQIPQTRPELQNIAINFRPMSVTTPHQDLSINRRGV